MFVLKLSGIQISVLLHWLDGFLTVFVAVFLSVQEYLTHGLLLQELILKKQNYKNTTNGISTTGMFLLVIILQYLYFIFMILSFI